MSLLGIDVGTTRCKAAVFSAAGELLASAYEEYDISRPHPGWAELDSDQVWRTVKRTIAKAVADPVSDSVVALAVSSLGEAVVPDTSERKVLGPSILNFDVRGADYLKAMDGMDKERLYRINGNTLGNHYSLTKLKWIKDHEPEVYARTDKFLPWGSFVSFMLGADFAVDYSLANRTLLLDLDRGTWSEKLLGLYASMNVAAEIMVKPDRIFTPEPQNQRRYDARFAQYQRLWPMIADYLRELATG